MQAAEPVVPASSAIKGWDARMQQQKGDVHQLMRTEETHGCSCIMSAGNAGKGSEQNSRSSRQVCRDCIGPCLAWARNQLRFHIISYFRRSFSAVPVH